MTFRITRRPARASAPEMTVNRVTPPVLRRLFPSGVSDARITHHLIPVLRERTVVGFDGQSLVALPGSDTIFTI
jgi:hypothetical protein